MIMYDALLVKQQLKEIECSETRVLRSVAGYGRIDEKRSIDISQELNAVTQEQTY
jgi:hypothetical protein